MSVGKGEEYFELQLQSVENKATENGVEEIWLHTNGGIIHTRFHQATKSGAAVIWVGGAKGGLDGPAGGLYARLSKVLAAGNISSLRLDYRYPNALNDCVLDTLLGIEYVKTRHCTSVALVGHSFGGAVVISAGAVHAAVAGVVAMSSQTYGTGQVAELSPKPLLLLHGTNDEILPDACSHDLYWRAKKPKEMKLYAGCGHGLDECRQQVDADLLHWLPKVLL